MKLMRSKDLSEGGGGVWLIGDHTNIFGMNTYLNQVGDRWGIHFYSDAVSPLKDYYQDNFLIPNIPGKASCGTREHETIASKKFFNHPVFGRNIEYCTILTSCSISAPIISEPISISRGTHIDAARFGGNTFFGNLNYDPTEFYGSVLQNIGLKVGRGRIAVFSDSTLFSNFAMCMTGVPEMALGYVNWLNRTNWF